MSFYIITLILGLMFIYTLRDLLLLLQNRRDEKAAISEKRAAEKAAKEASAYIIAQNERQCKRFERAS